MKKFEYVCPECKNDMDNEIVDVVWDDGLLIQKYCCGKCNATWKEYFILRYDGYSYNGQVFNADGGKTFE